MIGKANWLTAVGLTTLLAFVFTSSALSQQPATPPQNKPTPEELLNCQPFIDREFELLDRVQLFLALGSIGFKAILQLLERNAIPIGKPRPAFAHGALYRMGRYQVLASYHPSRQNTNTGKLTAEMFEAVFEMTLGLQPA